jgi:hypothetical protein
MKKRIVRQVGYLQEMNRDGGQQNRCFVDVPMLQRSDVTKVCTFIALNILSQYCT